LVDLHRVAADLQQRQHQRSEFMPHRDAREADRDVGAGADDGERGLARVVALAQGNLVGSRSNLAQQLAELARRLAVVQRRDEFDRLRQLFHVGRELGLEVCVEHGVGSWGEGGRGREVSRAAMTARDGLRAAALCGPRGEGQILPTRSSDGFRVLSPSFHLAGQTSPGCAATYWAALTLRSRSPASRPMPSAVISIAWITPSGSITKVPRSARPWSSRITSKLRVMVPVGSPIIV